MGMVRAAPANRMGTPPTLIWQTHGGERAAGLHALRETPSPL